jgi:hypothetical protein
VRSLVTASLRISDNTLLYPKPRLVEAPGLRQRTATGRNRPAGGISSIRESRLRHGSDPARKRRLLMTIAARRAEELVRLAPSGNPRKAQTILVKSSCRLEILTDVSGVMEPARDFVLNGLGICFIGRDLPMTQRDDPLLGPFVKARLYSGNAQLNALSRQFQKMHRYLWLAEDTSK